MRAMVRKMATSRNKSKVKAKLKPLDKAFFYSDFVIEEVV